MPRSEWAKVEAWAPLSWTQPGWRGWGRRAEPRQRQHQGARTTSLTSANSPDNVHISPNGSIITIVGTRPSNHGTYRCVASNAYGVAQSVVNLSVHGERPQP